MMIIVMDQLEVHDNYMLHEEDHHVGCEFLFPDSQGEEEW